MIVFEDDYIILEKHFKANNITYYVIDKATQETRQQIIITKAKNI